MKNIKGDKKKSKKGLKISAVVVSAITAAVVITNFAGKVIAGQEQYGKSTGYEWNSAQEFNDEHIKVIEANDTDTKILCLTDVHLRNYGSFAACLGVNFILDGVGKIALKKLISNVNPDLIVVLGDTVCTMRNDILLESFVKFMDSFKIPWAPVFGNHDEEGRADKAKLCDVLAESEYCLFEYGPDSVHGAGNYVVNITRSGKAVYSLYMLDSGAMVEVNGEQHEDGINEKQIEWYKWNADGISAEAGKTVPSMAFFHIPLKQYDFVTEYEFGEHGEQICSQYYDYGFFDTFKSCCGTHIFNK